MFTKRLDGFYDEATTITRWRDELAARVGKENFPTSFEALPVRDPEAYRVWQEMYSYHLIRLAISDAVVT